MLSTGGGGPQSPLRARLARPSPRSCSDPVTRPGTKVGSRPLPLNASARAGQWRAIITRVRGVSAPLYGDTLHARGSAPLPPSASAASDLRPRPLHSTAYAPLHRHLVPLTDARVRWLVSLTALLAPVHIHGRPWEPRDALATFRRINGNSGGGCVAEHNLWTQFPLNHLAELCITLCDQRKHMHLGAQDIWLDTRWRRAV